VFAVAVVIAVGVLPPEYEFDDDVKPFVVAAIVVFVFVVATTVADPTVAAPDAEDDEYPTLVVVIVRVGCISFILGRIRMPFVHGMTL
jgi:hypothetical protein